MSSTHVRASLVLAVCLIIGLAAAPARAEGRRIAVLEFVGAAPDDALASLGKGLQSMVTTDLAQVGALTLVERARLQEIRGELELGRSELVDPATAARIGKLAGATHLLDGSYTVAGDTMRLDARLVDVASGTIVLAEKIEGEAAAFFELEKALVREVVAALGVEPPPKERAALARIHTADLEAFRRFSQGIAAFDAERYDEAVAALREAAARDASFALARLTLTEYEAIIARLRARADQLHTARKELERLERQKLAAGIAGVVERLFLVAARTEPASRRERVTALYLLAAAYGGAYRSDPLRQLRAREDRFALERAADRFTAAYFAEASAAFPELPPTVGGRFLARFPGEKTFEADFARAAETLWAYGSDHPENRRNGLLDALEAAPALAARLHLDRRGEVELADRFFRLGVKLEPYDTWLRMRREWLAEAWRDVLDLDRSTAYWRELTVGVDNPWRLKGLAKEIERNRDIAAALGEADERPGLHEFTVLLTPSEGWWKSGLRRYFSNDRLTPGARYQLTKLRRLPEGHDLGGGVGRRRGHYVLVGDHPVWRVQGRRGVGTGPRPVDARRSDELRYYAGPGEADQPTLLIVDGRVAGDLRVSFTLAFEPPADWWPPRQPGDDVERLADVGIAAGRPTVSFLVGAVDIDVPPQEVPAPDGGRGERQVTRPMRALAVSVGPGGGAVARVQEGERARWGRKSGFDRDVLARFGGDDAATRGSVRVRLRVDGPVVAGRVGGERFRVQRDGPAAGMYGFLIEGEGFVAIRDLAVETAAAPTR